MYTIERIDEIAEDNLPVASGSVIFPEFAMEDLPEDEPEEDILEPMGGCDLGVLEGLEATPSSLIKKIASRGGSIPILGSRPPSTTTGPAPATSTTFSIRHSNPVKTAPKVNQTGGLVGSMMASRQFTKYTLLSARKARLASAKARAGRTKGPVAAKPSAPWLLRSMNNLATAEGKTFDPTRKAKPTFTPPPALAKKILEVRDGGFIGGKVGEAAKKVQKALLDRTALWKKMSVMASGASLDKLAEIRNGQNGLLAKIIPDMLRVERFRQASVLKTYSIMKAHERREHLALATKTSGSEQERHLLAAKEAGVLQAKTGYASRKILAQKMDVPGLPDMIASLTTPRTAEEYMGAKGPSETTFTKVAPPASRDPEFLRIPHLRDAWNQDPGGVAAVASMIPFGDLEWSFRSAVSSVTSAVSSVASIAKKAVPIVQDIAEGAAPILKIAGPIVADLPLAPIAQAVGGAMMAAGAGLAVAAEALKPIEAGIKLYEKGKKIYTGAKGVVSDVKALAPTKRPTVASGSTALWRPRSWSVAPKKVAVKSKLSDAQKKSVEYFKDFKVTGDFLKDGKVEVVSTKSFSVKMDYNHEGPKNTVVIVRLIHPKAGDGLKSYTRWVSPVVEAETETLQVSVPIVGKSGRVSMKAILTKKRAADSKKASGKKASGKKASGKKKAAPKKGPLKAAVKAAVKAAAQKESKSVFQKNLPFIIAGVSLAAVGTTAAIVMKKKG